jgi:hypothetical protein
MRRGVSVHTADYLLEGKFVSDRDIFVSFGMRERYRSAAKLPNVDLSAFSAFEAPAVSNASAHSALEDTSSPDRL